MAWVRFLCCFNQSIELKSSKGLNFVNEKIEYIIFPPIRFKIVLLNTHHFSYIFMCIISISVQFRRIYAVICMLLPIESHREDTFFFSITYKNFVQFSYDVKDKKKESNLWKLFILALNEMRMWIIIIISCRFTDFVLILYIH